MTEKKFKKLSEEKLYARLRTILANLPYNERQKLERVLEDLMTLNTRMGNFGRSISDTAPYYFGGKADAFDQIFKRLYEIKHPEMIGS